MASSIGTITFDCADPYRLAEFWSYTLGRPVSAECKPDDEEVWLDGEPGVLFIRVPEAKSVKNRVHLDLVPDGTRDDEVARLLERGARQLDDRRQPDGKGWVVLADPEGNELCILRGTAERSGD
jgi:hypothetical protein